MSAQHDPAAANPSRGLLDPAYVTFRSYLGAATLIAREKFARDQKLIRAHWNAGTLPESAFEEWVTERLLERSPIVGDVL